MRILSQEGLRDGTIDVSYEQCTLYLYFDEVFSENYAISAHMASGKSYRMAEYSSIEKAKKALELLRTVYTGTFITNADVPEDFNERLKEIMKGGFGAVIVKDIGDCRMELNNLNGYFKFPNDDEIEVQQ